jgi:hypothetical protein
MGEMRNVYKIFVGKSGDERPLRRLDLNERIILGLKWMLEKLGRSVRIGFMWLRIGTGDRL